MPFLARASGNMGNAKKPRKPCKSCAERRAKVRDAIRKRDLKLAAYHLSKGAAELLLDKKKL